MAEGPGFLESHHKADQNFSSVCSLLATEDWQGGCSGQAGEVRLVPNPPALRLWNNLSLSSQQILHDQIYAMWLITTSFIHTTNQGGVLGSGIAQ